MRRILVKRALWLPARVRGLALLGLGCSTALTGRAEVYSVTDLGVFTDLPGRTDSRPNAINATGKIAAANVANSAYRAWLYGGAWTNLGTLGGDESLASGINDSNIVVGYSRDPTSTQFGFVWTPGGTGGVAGNPQMRALGTFGGAESAAFGINRSNQISGYAQTSSRDHAFIYRNGSMTDLGAALPNNMGNSYGYGINDAGHVVGAGYNNNWSSWRAFYYDGTNTTDLGTFGGQNSAALAINNNEVIVGYYTLSSGFDHALRYAGGSMTDLGTLGGNYSYANGVNNSNVVVGGSFTDASNTIYHAFIWATNTMTDLNTCLDATGTGWTLVEARAINDAGQIVGTGARGGATHGFLLTPLTPPRITQQPTNATFTCGSTAMLTITATPSAVVYRWHAGSPPTGTPVANATNASLVLTNASAAQAGNYYVIVTNAAGSVTSSVANLTVVDTTPPVISGCPGNLTSNAAPNLCTAVVTWTSPTASDNCDGVVPVTCTPASGSTFNKGVTTVTCRAADSSRNTNSCSFTVTVQDKQAPALSGCPANLTNYIAVGASAPQVFWTTPTAVDNCDGVVPVSCTPTNGATFSQGVTSVLCQAHDASLNTNSCSFTVAVLGVPPPQITGLKLSGSNVLISFTTTNLAQYSVEASGTLRAGGWSNLVWGLVGNGAVQTATNKGAAAVSNRYYRVKLSPP
jgi:probable HAF family extracellular repeat protein